MHIRDVLQLHDAPARHRDPGLTEIECRFRATEDADRLLAATHLRATAGRIDVELTQLLVDLDRRDAERLHARGIELDAYLPVHAAAARHLGDALDREQALRDRVVDEPGQFLRRHVGGADGEIADRAALHVIALHHRLFDAVRQFAAHLGHGVAHVVDGPVDRCADLELDESQTLSFDRARGDFAHVADARHCAVDLLHHLGLDLGRRSAGLGDADHHQREGDVRIEVDRQANEGADTEEQQHQEHDERQDRVPDRPGGNVLHVVVLTVSPSRRKAPAVTTICSWPSSPEAITTPFEVVSATRTSRRATFMSGPMM